MSIACLGWGSLIWDPRGLPVRSGWFEDGPLLPIEFARESRDKRITLVLTPEATPVRSLWAVLSCTDLEAAREALRVREGVSKKEIATDIGWWSSGSYSNGLCVEEVRRWATHLGLEAVVWTALPPGLSGTHGVVPRAKQIVDHLRDLPPEERRRAEEYVRRTPTQVDTEVRRLLEVEFGWTPR